MDILLIYSKEPVVLKKTTTDKTMPTYGSQTTEVLKFPFQPQTTSKFLFSNKIVETSNRLEQRIPMRLEYLCEITFAALTFENCRDDVDAFVNFFTNIARGTNNGFLYQNPLDYKATRLFSEASTGIGTQGHARKISNGIYQLQKRYTYGNVDGFKTVYFVENVSVWVNDVLQAENVDYSLLNGQLTFTVIPEDTDNIEVEFNFYITVRFQNDRITKRISSVTATNFEGVILQELPYTSVTQGVAKDFAPIGEYSPDFIPESNEEIIIESFITELENERQVREVRYSEPVSDLTISGNPITMQEKELTLIAFICAKGRLLDVNYRGDTYRFKDDFISLTWNRGNIFDEDGTCYPFNYESFGFRRLTDVRSSQLNRNYVTGNPYIEPDFALALASFEIQEVAPNPDETGAPDPESNTTNGSGRVTRISLDETSAPGTAGEIKNFEYQFSNSFSIPPDADSTSVMEDIIGLDSVVYCIIRENSTQRRFLYRMALGGSEGTFLLLPGFVLSSITTSNTRYKIGSERGVVYTTRGRNDQTLNNPNGTWFLFFAGDGTITSQFLSDSDFSVNNVGSVLLANNDTLFIDNNFNSNPMDDYGTFAGFQIYARNFIIPTATISYPYQQGNFIPDVLDSWTRTTLGSNGDSSTIDVNGSPIFDIPMPFNVNPTPDHFDSYDGGQMRTITVNSYCKTGVNACSNADAKRVHFILHRESLTSTWRLIDDMGGVNPTQIDIFFTSASTPTAITLCDRLGNAVCIPNSGSLLFYRGGSGIIFNVRSTLGVGWRALGHSRMFGFIAYQSEQANFYDQTAAKTIYFLQ